MTGRDIALELRDHISEVGSDGMTLGKKINRLRMSVGICFFSPNSLETGVAGKPRGVKHKTVEIPNPGRDRSVQSADRRARMVLATHKTNGFHYHSGVGSAGGWVKGVQ